MHRSGLGARLSLYSVLTIKIRQNNLPHLTPFYSRDAPHARGIVLHMYTIFVFFCVIYTLEIFLDWQHIVFST